ncbi:MAG TPA: hypothetical protein VK795_08055 [Terriglobales bacterium]|nr:hypothetical protein [Terriglobales bacterium]
MNLSNLWRRIISTRYASTLEAEVARLRAENRALLNSILGIAGVPPLPATAADLRASQNNEIKVPEQPALVTSAQAAPRNRASSAGAVNGPHIAVPIRKRSWQQITRMLEFESAQKEKPAADAATMRAIARDTD